MADLRLPLPPAVADERFNAFAAAVEAEVAGIDGDLPRLLIWRLHAVDDPALLTQLAWQFHVMGVEGWDYAAGTEQRRALVENAIELHRYKGTPWAVRMALASAMNLDAAIEEADAFRRADGYWATYQIDPGRVLSRSEARAVAVAAAAWAPARSQLVRLHHGYDLRAARYDTPLGSALLMDDWSGIDVDGVRLSFSSSFASPPPAGEALVPYWAVSSSFGAVYHMRPGVRFDDNASDGAADDLPARPGIVVVSAWPSPDRGGRPPAFADRASLRAGAKDGMAWDDVGAVWDTPVHWRSTGEPPRYDMAPDAEPLVWRLDLLSTLRAPGFGDVVAVFPAALPPVAGSVVSIGVGVGRPPFRFDAPIDGRPLPAAGMTLGTGELLPVPGAGWGVGPWTDQPWGVATADFMMEV